MGFRDKMQQNAEAKVGDGHYLADVNQGRITMDKLTEKLNARWERGWKLAHIYEQAGNSVCIWEKRA